MDGGPGMPRPTQHKEDGSRTPGLIERAGNKLRQTWTALKTRSNEKNYEYHTNRGIPYPLDRDGQPKVATKMGFDKFKDPEPSHVAVDVSNDDLPSEDIKNEISAGGPTHPVVGGQDKD